ncbi:unnamed protein product [Kluyveromyces dobzhanskii CBS 2104]|uniref:WGS project CCBQ000000000 data, contig 00107 n=1 Tax=Kluyveromyces dobzhanskii CBS 2104 TaxID=1427455 RepID=A0A0A8L187_9SACH|nr:unnamed protein product [Kluyveromyces dobzhanskii CBS 2104]
MIRQDGQLVILPSKLAIGSKLDAGSYFMLKLGQNAIRFNSTRGSLEFTVSASDWDNDLEFILFKRRPRSKNDLRGCRRRDVLDRYSININTTKPKELNQYYVGWKQVELNSSVKHVQFIVDIEFFPSSGPIIPLKSLHSSHKEDSVKEVTVKNKPELQKQKRLPISNEKKGDSNQNPEPNVKFFPRFRRHSRHLKKHSPEASNEDISFDNVIEYDGKENVVTAGNYRHGFKIYEESVSDTSDVYSFIDKNKEKIRNYDHDTLVINETPKDILKDELVRFRLGDKLMFMHSFPTANVKLTGYLGNGRWSIPETSATRRQIYLLQQPSLPPPRLPPKCPKGMMWEEYYLLNKGKYIDEVIRT